MLLDKEQIKKKKINHDNKKKNKKKVVIGVTIIILLLTVVSCGMLITTNGEGENVIENITNKLNWGVGSDGLKKGQLTNDDLLELQKELQRNTDESMTDYLVPSAIVFDENGRGRVLLENSAKNKCYFQMQIIEDSTKTLIYESPVMEPDTSINYDTALTTFPEGMYDATIWIRQYSLDTEQLQIEIPVGIKIQFK